MPTSALTSTREALHRVAVHVVARARFDATGRFSLRLAPNGFGTPDLDLRRVRVSGGTLVVESDAPDDARAAGRAISGATLRELSAFAGVDLGTPLSVGRDTPQLGDVDAPIVLDHRALDDLARWCTVSAGVLDRLVSSITADAATATLPRLWPEHFDAAVETEARPGRRVNLGTSPGDAFCDRPYWYVGPWVGDRPGPRSFWNAPFGAMLPVASFDEQGSEAGLGFLLDGLAHLR